MIVIIISNDLFDIMGHPVSVAGMIMQLLGKFHARGSRFPGRSGSNSGISSSE